MRCIIGRRDYLMTVLPEISSRGLTLRIEAIDTSISKDG